MEVTKLHQGLVGVLKMRILNELEAGQVDNPGRKTSAPTLINSKLSALGSSLELGYRAAKYYSRGWRNVVEKQDLKNLDLQGLSLPY